MIFFTPERTWFPLAVYLIHPVFVIAFLLCFGFLLRKYASPVYAFLYGEQGFQRKKSSS